jgi:VCBS repeat-containing protein
VKSRPKHRRTVARRPQLEILEPRIALDADALAWGGDASFTLSFAPDGTRIAGVDSSLNATLGALGSQTDWQTAILKGFQTWAAETNGSIGVVADGGQDFGVAGPTRHDPRFGDIRIGAAPLGAGILAITIPADELASGTWVGDVVFNVNAPIANLDELYAVALHEAGHVFGLKHNTIDPNSPMAEAFHSSIATSATPAPSDLAALVALHGVKQPDLNELVEANDSTATATHLDLNNAPSLPEGSAPSVIYGVVSSPGDRDFFRIVTPEGYTGPLTFTLRTQGVSLLAARLTVLDASGGQIGVVEPSGVQGEILTFTLPQTEADKRYYGVVEGARGDAFGLGDYALAATLDALNAIDAGQLSAAMDGSLRFLPQDEIAKLFNPGDEDHPNFNDDAHTDDDAASGASLEPAAGYAPKTRYETTGSVADALDVDNYKLSSPSTGGPFGFTVRIRSLEAAGLIPRVEVLDENRNPLPVQTIVNGAGELVVQVSGVAADSEVTVRVSAQTPGGLFSTGNYRMTASFGADPIVLTPVAAGQLTPSAPLVQTAFHVAQPQLFHFVLTANSAAQLPSTAVAATILDETNAVVFRVFARPGETRSAGSVLLKPGSYRIQFASISSGGPLAGTLDYGLAAHVASTPYVADPNDPTFQPEFACSDPGLAGYYCYPGNIISPDPYLWTQFQGTLDPPPQLPLPELIQSLLANWWTWFWQQAGVNGPPLALRDHTLTMPGGGATTLAATAPLNVLANDVDPEQDPVVALLRTTTTHGSLVLNPDGTFQYAPDAGFEGVDTFTYTAYDFISESDPATVRISVGLRGDHDSNRIVDGADFLLWQRSSGSAATPPGSGSDATGDGLVNVEDLITWADNFAMEIPPGVGDFSRDGAIDGADLLLWQRTLGDAATPAGQGADGDGSGVIDGADLALWQSALGGAGTGQAAFGVAAQSAAFSAAVSAASLGTPGMNVGADDAAARDAAFTMWSDGSAGSVARRTTRPSLRGRFLGSL